jgi:hypothetical protein
MTSRAVTDRRRRTPNSTTLVRLDSHAYWLLTAILGGMLALVGIVFLAYAVSR